MSPDFLDLLRALSDADARFLVVGAYAVGVHGRPRATKDLDVWVEASAYNAPKVVKGLMEFGAPLMGLTEADLSTPGVGLQIGVEPGRIDILTSISGVRFEDAWLRKVQANFAEGLRCNVIGLVELLQNKRAAGRPQDLADVAALEQIHRLKQ
jgi:predicted nucleotidyltransferase